MARKKEKKSMTLELESEDEEEPARLGGMTMGDNWKKPNVKTSVWLTPNGKWVVHKTTVTEIKPLAYYEKVFA